MKWNHREHEHLPAESNPVPQKVKLILGDLSPIQHDTGNRTESADTAPRPKRGGPVHSAAVSRAIVTPLKIRDKSLAENTTRRNGPCYATPPTAVFPATVNIQKISIQSATQQFAPMKAKTLIVIAITALGLLESSSLSAKEFKLPNADFAIASVDIPNSWKPEVIDNGIEAQTEDASFYLAIVAAGTDKGVTEDIEGTKDMLKEHKVKIDESTQKTGKGQVNGFETKSFTIKGKDEDGPCTVTILLVSIKDKVLIFTYWFTDSELSKHEKEVDAIQASLKASS